ncbi:reverse transcriptase family protein [Methylobacterium indicum]|nr:reverse transcriptase family protein [Methylobacterium indicum]
MKETKRYALDQSPLYKLRNRKKLAEILHISARDLRFLSKNANALYHEFQIKKKDGGVRGVENPSRPLKLVQANLARLLARIAPPDYLFCPVKGRCYVTNAARHRGQRVVRCLDVRKYFPSTSSKRVFWFFHKIMKCEADIAATLTSLSTYQGHLPTGSPLSPMLAYYAHYDVWQTIADICAYHNYNLSVYIDDVTVSGPSVSAVAMWQIKTAIHRSGLRYHKEKFFHGRPSEITGVIVAGDKLSAPNRQLKKIASTKRQIKISRRPDDNAKLKEQLTGLNGQIKQIASRQIQKI